MVKATGRRRIEGSTAYSVSPERLIAVDVCGWIGNGNGN